MVCSSDDHQVLDAPADVQLALFNEAQVSSIEPSIDQSAGRRFAVVEVPHHHRWTSNEDSPRATLGQHVTALAADLDFHSRHGRTHRCDLERAASNLASAGELEGINAQRLDLPLGHARGHRHSYPGEPVTQ